MFDRIYIANFGAAQFALTRKFAQIVDTNPIPTVARHDMAVFGRMTTLAKCFAVGRCIFPRQTPGDVSPMVNLEHDFVERSRAQASRTATTMKLDNVLSKSNPIGMSIMFQLGRPASNLNLPCN